MARTRTKDFPFRDEKDRIKEYAYTCTLYPDSKTYDLGILKLWIQAQAKDWCFALHDQDSDQDGVLKKTHVHAYFRFENRRLLSSVANSLGLNDNDLTVLNLSTGDDKHIIKYFAHLTKKAIEEKKHKYDWHSFDTNIDIEPIFVDSRRRQADKIGLIVDFINSTDIYISYKMILAFARESDTLSELIRGNWVLKGLLNEHNQSYKSKHRTFVYSHVPGAYGVPYDLDDTEF